MSCKVFYNEPDLSYTFYQGASREHTREYTREYSRVSIKSKPLILNNVFKRSASREHTREYTREYSIVVGAEKSAVKSKKNKAQKTNSFNQDNKQPFVKDIDSYEQKSESLLIDPSKVASLVKKAKLNMKSGYKIAKQRRARMDDIDWRVEKALRKLKPRCSRDYYHQVVRAVHRMSKTEKANWLEKVE